MRGLEHLLVRGQRESCREQPLAGTLVICEMLQQHRHVGVLEVVGGLLDLVLMEHVAVGHASRGTLAPQDVVDALDTLQVHGEPLESVGDLAGHGATVEAADLLEVGELRDFHAVQPHFPPQAPGAERGRFPVVLDEAHVVHQGV